jgi:hypothetical protein
LGIWDDKRDLGAFFRQIPPRSAGFNPLHRRFPDLLNSADKLCAADKELGDTAG